jgi:hypothetical protein
LERIEGTVRGMQPLQGYTEIFGGGSNIRMAKQNLDGAEIGAGIQHVCGACVAEQVRVNRMFDAGPTPCIAAQRAQRIVIERLIAMLFGREQPIGRLPPAVVDSQSLCCPASPSYGTSPSAVSSMPAISNSLAVSASGSGMLLPLTAQETTA